MGSNISRILIETTVRRALREIQTSPQRGIRNLVDMGLNFSDGRFQRKFFGVAQELLRNERSAYYALVQDIAAHVDHDTATAFGINVGYNSFIRGAEQIRKLEAKRGFNIPWNIAIQHKDGQPDAAGILAQGKRLGIFTYTFFPTEDPSALFPLAAAQPECAFVLFCRSGTLTEQQLAAAAALHNVMFVVEQTSRFLPLCSSLRDAKLLYSVYVDVTPENLNWVLGGSALTQAVQVHPVFTFFRSDRLPDKQAQAALYNYVCRIRQAQAHPTVLVDFRQDNVFIDSIISDDACALSIRADGTVMDGGQPTPYSVARQPLETILRAMFPKA